MCRNEVHRFTKSLPLFEQPNLVTKSFGVMRLELRCFDLSFVLCEHVILHYVALPSLTETVNEAIHSSKCYGGAMAVKCDTRIDLVGILACKKARRSVIHIQCV